MQLPSIKIFFCNLNKVIERLTDDENKVYNLNDFNCTNAGIDALSYINVKLPSTISARIFFTGNDPGDLGEDIRA